MSEGMVQKWVRMFNGGRKNVHNEERSGCPSLITKELVYCKPKVYLECNMVISTLT